LKEFVLGEKLNNEIKTNLCKIQLVRMYIALLADQNKRLAMMNQ
jgi:uncharacterized protein YacL (UPF0231 family)